MDDESIFGEEFFYIGFDEAIRVGRLADYKVIILTVDEKNIRTTIDFYNSHEATNVDPTKFVWGFDNVQNKNRGIKFIFDAAQF